MFESFNEFMRILYHKGHPSLGMWGGLNAEDICTVLAPGTTSDTWRASPDHCERMIERDFQSKMVVLQALLGAVLIYMFFSTLWNAVLYCTWRLFSPRRWTPSPAVQVTQPQRLTFDPQQIMLLRESLATPSLYSGTPAATM